MKITAEDADDAENADEEELRLQAVRLIAFTHWGEMGFISWLPPNRCSSAFFVSSASSVVTPIAVFRLSVARA